MKHTDLPPGYTVTKKGKRWENSGPGSWGTSGRREEAVRWCWVSYFCDVERQERAVGLTHGLLRQEKERARAELDTWTKREHEARAAKVAREGR